MNQVAAGNRNALVTASRARHVVLWFASTLAIVTYLDRVCISQAAPMIQRDLKLSKEEMGLVFAAFGWAYALFEIPGGWLGDRIGPRKVLMRVVAMWSIFTIATGWAWNLVSLVVCRFLFGVGEAGCFPNITKAFTLWFPRAERVRAQGVLWISARWGGAFTPLLVGWMLAGGHDGKPGLGLHYKWVFLSFGVIGMVWAVLFYRWFRNHPQEHPSVNPAELAHIGVESYEGDHAMPWGRLLASRTVWMLWGQYFFMSFSWYFYITWFPTYLRETFPTLTEMQQALLACVPLFCGGTGSMLAGVMSARIDRAVGSIARTRRILGVGGMICAGLMLEISILFRQPLVSVLAVESPELPLAAKLAPLLSVLAVGMASLLSDLSLPGSWGACMDVGGRYTGALGGSMNMMGNIGGAIAPMVVPFVLAHTHNSWTSNIHLFAVAYFLAAVFWAFVNSDDRLHD